MKRKLVVMAGCALLLLCAAFGGGLWDASNQLLFPVAHAASKNFSVCKQETAKYWGDACGNLRTTHAFQFREVRIPSLDGYALPAWSISASDNGTGPALGAIILVHGGGSDRREHTKYVRFFLNRHLDVITLDLGCHGEAPCPVPGLSYGDRESRAVLSAYLQLEGRYPKLYAMGTSVGAAAILIALPAMPKLSAAIAENPMLSFERLIMETPSAPKAIPAWFKRVLLGVTMLRGRFDGLLTSANSLRIAKTTPIYFIHSRQDSIVPYRQTQELADLYQGPKALWLSDRGEHSAIWDVDHAEYERRLAAFVDQIAPSNGMLRP